MRCGRAARADLLSAMKKINARAGNLALPIVPAIPAKAFKSAIDAGKSVLVDTRSMLAFGGGHIPGALNIGGSPSLSIGAGWLLDPAKRSCFVLEKYSALEMCEALHSHRLPRSSAGTRGRNQSGEAAGYPVEQGRS